MPAQKPLTLADDGAVLYAGLANPMMADLETALFEFDQGKPGHRIGQSGHVAALLNEDAPLGALANQLIGQSAFPVRAVLFDKNSSANWALGWHQDRTICVKARHDVAGFGPWTIKNGLDHVEPPFEYVQRMITLRIHLDAVSHDNAPLMIVPGSHHLGRIPVTVMAAIVAQLGEYPCLASKGDVWAYSTPIIHASGKSTSPARRRVLQVDYSADRLPYPLEWMRVG